LEVVILIIHKISMITMMLSRAVSRAARPLLVTRSFASVGDKLPSVELHQGFPPKKIDIADYAASRNIILLGLPGAFTPT
jgi:hypothetical protein